MNTDEQGKLYSNSLHESPFASFSSPFPGHCEGGCDKWRCHLDDEMDL